MTAVVGSIIWIVCIAMLVIVVAAALAGCVVLIWFFEQDKTGSERWWERH